MVSRLFLATSSLVCIRFKSLFDLQTACRLTQCMHTYSLILFAEFLNIGSSSISGSIPPEISQLTPNLKKLYLYRNPYIESSIPSEIGNLSQLGMLCTVCCCPEFAPSPI